MPETEDMVTDSEHIRGGRAARPYDKIVRMLRFTILPESKFYNNKLFTPIAPPFRRTLLGGYRQHPLNL